MCAVPWQEQAFGIVLREMQYGVDAMCAFANAAPGGAGVSGTAPATPVRVTGRSTVSPSAVTLRSPTATSPLLSPVDASVSPSVVLPSDGTLEWAEVEAHVMDNLTFLAALRDMGYAVSKLRSQRVLQLLALSLRHGSPRVQRLALILLDASLPASSLTGADVAFSRAGFVGLGRVRASHDGESTVGHLLAIAADTLTPALATRSLSSSSSGDPAVAHPVGYGCGHVAHALRCLVVNVLRSLLAAAPWYTVVHTALVQAVATALQRGGGAGGSSPLDSGALKHATVALQVLCGCGEVLRVGARVVSEQTVREAGIAASAALFNTQWAGTVVRYSRGAVTARVVFADAGVPTEVEASALLPLDPPPLPSTVTLLTPSLATALLAILSEPCVVDVPAEDEADGDDADDDADAAAAKGKALAARGGGAGDGDLRLSMSSTLATQLTVSALSSSQGSQDVFLLAKLQRTSVAALERLVDGPTAARVVFDAGLLPPLLARARVIVHTSTIVPERDLQDRATLLQERLYEWLVGVRCGKPEGAAGAEVATAAMSAEEAELNGKAEMLQSMGFDLPLCLKGLQMMGGDVERVAEWLLSGEVRAEDVQFSGGDCL